MMMPPDDAITNGSVRRIEVFTGAGHRRRWTKEEKARIVAESYGGRETASAVARRYGLAQTQLFTWRRELRELAAPRVVEEPAFIPVMIDAAPTPQDNPPPSPPEPKRQVRRRRERGGIEMEIGDVTVRVGVGADARTITAVIRALKAGS